MFALYEDQEKAVTEAVKNLKVGKNVLLYSPTASGKTVMGSEIVRRMNLKTIFMVNRQTLVSQSYDKLYNHGLSVSIYHNTITRNIEGDLMNDDFASCDVLVSLVETLENSGIDFIPQMIVFDECHKATSESYQKFRDKYPDVILLGLTATPGRENNKEGELLSDWYDIMVIGDTVLNLINKGRLAKPVYKTYDSEDHVVNTWISLTGLDDNKRTIIFAENATHMISLKKAFLSAGINAEYISSGSELEEAKDEIVTMTNNQRNNVFKKFREGEIEVLISWGVLCEGFDEPLAKYCFLLRKVSTVALLHQMIGRVLRIAPNKNEGYICDFKGNIDEYGPIEYYIWEMDGTCKEKALVQRSGDTVYMGYFKRRPKVFVVCDDCNHTYDTIETDLCPCCNCVNHVNISATFKQWKEFFYEKIDPEIWNTFKKKSTRTKDKDLFWTFFEIMERALKLNMTNQFNQLYGEIFYRGKFLKEYVWMEQLIGKKGKITNETRIVSAV